MALDKLKYTYQDPAKVSELNVDDVLNVTNTINTTNLNTTFGNISSDGTNVGLTLKSPIVPNFDLQQFKNSSNVVTSGINAAGQMYFGSTQAFPINAYNLFFSSLVATSATSAAIFYSGSIQPVSVGQQVQIPSSTPSYFTGTWTVTSVTGSQGGWYFNVAGSGFTPGGISTGANLFRVSPSLSIKPTNAHMTPLVIQADPSHQHYLVEFLGTSGTRVASINSLGQGSFNSVTTTGGVLPAYMQDTSLTGPQISFLGNSVGTANTSGVLVKALGANQRALLVRASSTTATISAATANGTTISYSNNNSQFFYPGMTVTITGVVSTGNPSGTAGSGFNLTNATVASANLSTFTVTNSLVDTYTSGGLATPTSFANLQEWQDKNSGTVAYVNAAGGAGFTGNTVLSGGVLVQGNYGGSNTMAISNNQNIIGLNITGTSGQTANLQQWNNSGGGVLAAILSSGYLLTAGLTDVAGNGAYLATGPSSPITINTRTSTITGLIVKGVASQSVDLQQWQDSTGAILSKIDTVGNFSKGDGDQLVLASQVF